MSCGHEAANYKSPICAALKGKGAPDPNTDDANIPVQQLPRLELHPLSIQPPCSLRRWPPEESLAEFNMEDTPATMRFKYHFQAPVGPRCHRHSLATRMRKVKE
ncbi:NAD-dependent protein deacylase sirtuin-5, mitochondrial [Collichthys lucidus]|uniref:NAD-dependent protein deacylase sirtuin-5, mitochondrial n=1 Tax=Collichthys lucidus TaxID=240159 RepID=A0A4U5UJX9_COLLU|nr:NAD-dependent protein deacylase sirtuin-5, mitochondrial [Collichthys lucidus]